MLPNTGECILNSPKEVIDLFISEYLVDSATIDTFI
jgi:hypothetical protein